VLDPLAGYLWLATVLSRPSLRPYDQELFDSSFNFGPGLESNRSVAELVQEVLKHWPGTWEDRSDPNALHEAMLLNVATDKTFHLLGCKPVWTFEKAVEATVTWYRAAHDAVEWSSTSSSLMDLTSQQIARYQRDAATLNLPWQIEASPALPGT